jgi:hypothetical protein
MLRSKILHFSRDENFQTLRDNLWTELNLAILSMSDLNFIICHDMVEVWNFSVQWNVHRR